MIQIISKGSKIQPKEKKKKPEKKKTTTTSVVDTCIAGHT